MADEKLLLTPEDLDKLAKEYPLLDFSFEDDYREEVKIIREAQLAKVKQNYDQRVEEAKVRGLEAGKALGRKEALEPNVKLLEIGRKAIEDALIDWRDNRLSEFTRGNGLVVREKDGKDSSIIRFGPETALKIGMKAMGETLKGG